MEYTRNPHSDLGGTSETWVPNMTSLARYSRVDVHLFEVVGASRSKYRWAQPARFPIPLPPLPLYKTLLVVRFDTRPDTSLNKIDT